ncbi:MAG: hypothetical protein ACRDSZ_07500 [Pseudonocardiaceae bacterium]
MTPVIRSGLSVYETSYDVLCRLLRKVLVDGVRAGRGAVGGIGSVQFRVSAALYALLLAHPLDEQGRCRSCRRPGAVFGRRRRCWVHREASYWLRQPEEFLHSRVVWEWGLVDQSRSDAGGALEWDSGTRSVGLDTTDVLPRIVPDVGDPPTQSLQAPVVSPAPIPPVGRPDRDHGGAGEPSDSLRLRRDPPENPPPSQSGWSLLLTGGIT